MTGWRAAHLDGELPGMDSAWAAPKALPTLDHVGAVVRYREEETREDIVRQACVDARLASLRIDRIASVARGERRGCEQELADLPIVALLADLPIVALLTDLRMPLLKVGTLVEDGLAAILKLPVPLAVTGPMLNWIT